MSQGERDRTTERAGAGVRAVRGPLSRQEELRCAKALQAARRAFASSVLALPYALRRQVLDGDEEGPCAGHRWPLRRLERCYVRLSRLGQRVREPRTRMLVRACRRHKARIDRARNRLILSNLALVAHVAKGYDTPYTTFADLLQEGTLGLIIAVERFEWDRGYKFSTYAYWWIRNAISKAVANQSAIIRLPTDLRARLRSLRRARQELRASLGREPVSHEVASRMGLSTEQVRRLAAVVRDPCPLESFDDEGSPSGFLCRVRDRESRDPMEVTLGRELRERIALALGDLSPRERAVVLRRFGFDGEPGSTLEELGQLLGLSRERVRQIERRSLAKLNSALTVASPR